VVIFYNFLAGQVLFLENIFNKVMRLELQIKLFIFPQISVKSGWTVDLAAADIPLGFGIQNLL
jgi:hypothetical protein